jgi:hypothetical protein
MWQRVVPPATYTWADAKTYCTGLTLGGLTGWRLPMRMELVSIVDYAVFYPAINTTVFPNTPSEYFWCASPDASSVAVAWVVNFNYGVASDSTVSTSRSVRCVR